ncbi:MAG: ATP cone domain-containing protein [Flavobacteriaceae bacterium]
MEIQKASGQRVKFSLPKLRKSLQRSGADQKTIQEILDRVRDELYQGISTQEIYNRAFAMLKKRKSIFASKYKLKKAIYELGPTGFPFERFVAALLEYSGYEVAIGQYFHGKCVSHEVDVVAKKNGQYIVAECKFHGDPSRKCDVKVPLYIHSRYMDILNDPSGNLPNEGWVVTNTQFTQDAVAFGTCVGLFLLSWDFPKENSLKDRIDRLGLYPITVSTLMSEREKGFLLERDVVLCRQLLQKHFYLDHLGISEQRKDRIMNEMKMLANRY